MMAVYTIYDKCNLKCLFCSNEDFIESFKNFGGKLPSYDDLEKDFEKTIGKEDNITLTGGEPTLRKDLPRIIGFLNSKKTLDILLLTNGRMFYYDSCCRKFSGFGKLQVEVALNSHKEEIHDKLTCYKGSYRETVSGIQNLLKNGIKTNIRIVLNALNYKDFDDFARFIVHNFPDLNKVVIANMRLRGEAEKNKKLLFRSYSDMFPNIYSALDILLENKISIELLHFPFCLLKEKYWEFTLLNPYKKVFSQCKKCKMVDSCPGFMNSYVKNFGEDEIRPI